MKNNILLFLVSLLIINNIKSECFSSSSCSLNEKTFFRPKPVIEDQALFLGMNNYRIFQKYLDIPAITEANQNIIREDNYFFHGVLFFENSKKPQELKNYFFPQGYIKNNDNFLNNLQNYLICPQRQTVGMLFNYHQDFCFLQNLWANARFAVYRAKHTFLLECNNCCAGSSSFLKQLNFEKISLCPQKKVGIDDIQLDVGYTICNEEHENTYLNIYGSIILPSASKPKGDFLFEPLVGRGHWGLGVGLNGGLKIFENLKDKRYMSLLADLTYQYFFSNCEFRLLRSNNAPASEINQNLLDELNVLSNQIESEKSNKELQDTIKAIKVNFLQSNSSSLIKQKLKVTPRGLVNLWLALHYQHFSWNIELGYTLWWKQSEKICLCSNDFSNNINVASAAQPMSLTNKIYALTGYFTTMANHTIPIFAGASYEFAKDKNALEQWQIWLGAEFAF